MLDNFTQSISQEIEINQERAGGFPIITSGHVDTIQKDQNIENLVVAVKPDSLPPAYRTADQQIFVVTGGAGSMENADPLKAVFVKNLYDGTKDRFVRAQFMGIVKPQHLPDWGHKAYTQHREAQQKKNKNAPER